MGALAFYDYFLTLDDEVCQLYPPSGVHRYLKPAQDILRLEEKEKLEWVHPSPPQSRSHRPLLVSYLFLAVRSLVSEAVFISRLNYRTAMYCSSMQ